MVYIEIYWECTVRKGRYKNKDVSKQMTEVLNMPDLLMLENSTGGVPPLSCSRAGKPPQAIRGVARCVRFVYSGG